MTEQIPRYNTEKKLQSSVKALVVCIPLPGHDSRDGQIIYMISMMFFFTSVLVGYSHIQISIVIRLFHMNEANELKISG